MTEQRAQNLQTENAKVYFKQDPAYILNMLYWLFLYSLLAK